MGSFHPNPTGIQLLGQRSNSSKMIGIPDFLLVCLVPSVTIDICIVVEQGGRLSLLQGVRGRAVAWEERVKADGIPSPLEFLGREGNAVVLYFHFVPPFPKCLLFPGHSCTQNCCRNRGPRA